VAKLDQMYRTLISGQIGSFNTAAPSDNRAVAEGLAIWAARPSQGDVPGLENFLYTMLGTKPAHLAVNPDIAEKLVSSLVKGAKLKHSDAANAGALTFADTINSKWVATGSARNASGRQS
jgi:NitT/TauT family transport system substrate-binding protein